MLVGTSMAGVKAWHLDTSRIVGEYCPEAVRDPMAHVLAIAASPTDQVFAASMATSAAVGWQAAGRLMLFNFRTLLKVRGGKGRLQGREGFHGGADDQLLCSTPQWQL